MQGPDNYVVQNASFCLSKINDFVQNFVQNAAVRIVPGLRLYFKTEILLLFQYVTYQNSLDVSNNWQ